MRCPNCGKEMIENTNEYYSIGEWDADYPNSWTTTYKCKECKIYYEESGYAHYTYNSEWKIPKHYERPTEKQLNCIQVINNVLGLNFEAVLKKQATEFIGKYIDKSKVVSEQRKQVYSEAFDDYLFDVQ